VRLGLRGPRRNVASKMAATPVSAFRSRGAKLGSMGSSADSLRQGAKGLLQGKLLIAMPGMADPRFERSVVFMCVHSESGAMGIIVNKPFAGLGFGELMKRLEIDVSQRNLANPVLFGGPVETEKGFVLHSGDYASQDATLSVTDAVSLTTSRDVLCAIGGGNGPENWLFALGYAGWGAGQIEEEIAHNGWVHCDADRHLLFEVEHELRWRSALAKLGIDLSGLSAEAGRA
jgi:putative transcriptional regulator